MMGQVRTQGQSVDLVFPPKLQFLFKPSRYKVAYGGRGGAKSWGFARALLANCVQTPIRVLCVREVQTSIKESVHKLLCDQIVAMGLESRFDMQKTQILADTGSGFFFEGIRMNADKIKSYEGIDVCWAEEAHNISEDSWNILIPTIRKPGSEIWVTFNPRLKTDATYQRFVISTPTNSQVVKINWQDNPWFPEVLKVEMEDLKARDFDAYLNVWEGHCINTLSGAIYANELRAARAEGRITKVLYDPTVPVDTFWDLGWLDSTVIWLGQKVGQEYHVIDYIEDSKRDIGSYLKQLENRRYVYGTFWLPHDAKAKSLGTGRSIEEMVRATGRTVKIVPKLSVSDGINAARTIFPLTYFDETNCEGGLRALSHYQNGPDGKPLHDWNSHGADGFRYLAVALKSAGKSGTLDIVARLRARREGKLAIAGGFGWMK